MNLSDFNKIDLNNLENIFKTKFWYLVFLDENNDELKIDEYYRVKLTNPLYGSIIKFNHDLYFTKKSNFTELSLTTENMLHYIINQEYDYENSTKKESITRVKLYFYRNKKDPTLFSKELFEYISKNNEQFNKHIIINEHNDIIGPLENFEESSVINMGTSNFFIEFSYDLRLIKKDLFNFLKKGLTV